MVARATMAINRPYFMYGLSKAREGTDRQSGLYADIMMDYVFDHRFWLVSLDTEYVLFYIARNW